MTGRMANAGLPVSSITYRVSVSAVGEISALFSVARKEVVNGLTRKYNTGIVSYPVSLRM